MIRVDFEQGMESVSSLQVNTASENDWLVYPAATVIWPYHVGYYFQSLSSSKTSIVDCDNIVPLSVPV